MNFFNKEKKANEELRAQQEKDAKAKEYAERHEALLETKFPEEVPKLGEKVRIASCNKVIEAFVTARVAKDGVYTVDLSRSDLEYGCDNFYNAVGYISYTPTTKQWWYHHKLNLHIAFVKKIA